MSHEEEEGDLRSKNKRTSSYQLTDRDDPEDRVHDDDGGTWKKADASVIQTRKIIKVRGSRASNGAPAAASPPPAPAPADAVPAKPFTFGTQPTETKANEASTPPTTKDATPVKEAPATPTKDDKTPSTPTKDATPTKNGTEVAPAGGTPSKAASTTPTKEDTKTATSTPEAPKPFSFATTTFAFPTSFSQGTSFSFGSTTTPSFSSTNSTPTPAFSGFKFPSVNFGSGGNSIFGAPKKEGEGEDEEGGEDNANPEEEVAITGTNTLPIITTTTGEEDEKNLFSVRGKLYAMADAKWQERGVGQLKLNQAKDGKCRLLMRDQGGKHLRLNTFVFPEMKIEKPGEKMVQFVAIGNGGGDGLAGEKDKPFTSFMVRVARKEEAEEIFDALKKYKGTSSSTSTTKATTTTTATEKNEST